jgi:opacity protein-like surface antigen
MHAFYQQKSNPMKIAFTKSITTATFICSAMLMQAQVTQSKYILGINAGTFIYQGDLTPSAIGSFKTPGLVAGINGSRYLTNKLALRLDLNFGKLRGDDAAYDNPSWRRQRALAFKTPATEVIGSVVWDAFGIERKFSPYLFAGIGYSFLKIKRDYSSFNQEYFASEPNVEEGLRTDINHRLPGGLPIVPFGVGLRYQLTSSLALNTEASYRYISSDYLDGFSHAANADAKDHYYKFSVGLSYSRNNNGKGGLDCPKF